jgi:hypothetical protein
VIIHCHSCGQPYEFRGSLGRRDVCSHCEAELRCCAQCHLYEPASARQCSEPQAEVPREKDRANFCDFFSPGDRPAAAESDVDKAKAAFEALFTKR